MYMYGRATSNKDLKLRTVPHPSLSRFKKNLTTNRERNLMLSDGSYVYVAICRKIDQF